MGQPQMTYSLDHRGDAMYLTLAGELDLSTTDQLQAALNEATAPAPKTLIIDLGAVSFIDSQSIGLLVNAYNTTAADGRRPVVVNPHGLVLRALEVMGLLNLLTHPFDNAPG